MSAPTTYELRELTSFLHRVFALNLPDAVWVRCELAQVNLSRGNYWLTLVQKDEASDRIISQLEAVLWQSQLRDLQRRHGLRMLRDILQPGLSVRLKASVRFHERYGLRLTLEDVDPTFTLGELERRRQATLENLRAAGHLERNALLPLPSAIQRIAVISSDTAAGLADFSEQLRRNPYGYQVKESLLTAAMQGENASREIQARLRGLTRRRYAYDAVVIIRGGGSRMDLAAFDEENLAVAVATCPLPVIVGIGHETDTSVLDQVAHTSLKTPTAVAAWLIDRLVRLEGTVLRYGQAIEQLTRQALLRERPRLDRLLTSAHQLAGQTLRSETQRLSFAEQQLRQLGPAALRRSTRELDTLERLLQALHPDTTLARGYALVTQGGKILTDAGEVASAEPLTIRLRRGRVRATPTEE